MVLAPNGSSNNAPAIMVLGSGWRSEISWKIGRIESMAATTTQRRVRPAGVGRHGS